MAWQLFDRIAAFAKANRVYRKENLFTDQSSLVRIMSGGEFFDFNTQSALLQQTNLQINRLERYKDFDQMDEVGEISLALDLYADEASRIDPERKHSLLVRAKSLRVKYELENFYYNIIRVDSWLWAAIRYLCKYGDLPFEVVPERNRDGVASLRTMDVYNFTRVETKFGDLVGFYYQDEVAKQPTFFHPWQVVHARLSTFDSIYSPYGRSILDPARKHFKQLRLMEDAALVYRISRAPEKRVFKIPVGNIPTKDVPQYIEIIARQIKKRRFFDPASGDVSERWHPLIQEDDYWLPQRADGAGPEVDTLPGAQNLDEIADIEYFKKKMISGLKIPFNRVGIGDADDSSREPVSKTSPEFATAVQRVQREMTDCLKKVGIIHLAMRGYSAEDLRNFDLTMTAASAIDELTRIETWVARAEVIEALKGTEMFPDKWILRSFTDMTDDEIEQMQEEKRKADEEAQAALGDLGLGGDMGAGAPGGDLGLGGLGGPDAGGGLGIPALEGYDHELESRVLREYLTPSQPPVKKIEEHFDSGFDWMLNQNELDGLDYGRDERGRPMIIEAVLEPAQVKEALDEAKLQMESDDDGWYLDFLDEDDEVSVRDLP